MLAGLGLHRFHFEPSSVLPFIALPDPSIVVSRRQLRTHSGRRATSVTCFKCQTRIKSLAAGTPPRVTSKLAASHRDDFSQDRDCNLLGRDRAQIKPSRGLQFGQPFGGYAVLCKRGLERSAFLRLPTKAM